MIARKARDRQHRQIVGVSLVVSLALHAVILGALSFHAPEQDGEVGERAQSGTELPFESTFIELIEIDEVPEPVELELVDAALPVLATPTPEQKPEPATGETSRAAPSAVAEAGSGAAAPSAVTDVVSELAEFGLKSRVALSMKPQFTTQRSMPGARQPIEAVDPHAGHDHVEADGDEEESWWRRLGISVGRGGGRICKPPRPPVVIREAAITP